ncbi:MAG: IS66 family transposase [bacterium]|nr:IS66 family transposase [bacterium]
MGSFYLSGQDLRQLDESRIESLPLERLQELSKRLAHDLKLAHEQLERDSTTSSLPPSSDLPWTGVSLNEAELDESEAQEEPTEASAGEAEEIAEAGEVEADEPSSTEPKPKPRKAGKQPGAPGYGRGVELPVMDTLRHYPQQCAACAAALPETLGQAWTGHYTLDLICGSAQAPGIEVSHVKHVYYETCCDCGHCTRCEPGRGPSDRQGEELEWTVELSEWHLVGPTLMSLIVFLALRMRLSRARIQEILADWLGIYLSIGVLDQCVHEAGRAVEPVEAELIEALNQAEVLHADETGWKEGREALWWWVFVSTTTVLFLVGYRRREVIEAVLSATFSGWLMSDGYHAYRHRDQRLRCWAHLLRKARALKRSYHPASRRFGHDLLELFATLIEAIYHAREGPPLEEALSVRYHADLEALRVQCHQHQDSEHEATAALARELLNDWAAIWAVLDHPHLPLTNNRAEQALRHWVILRKISFGTRTEQGSRALALLASVIETCRLRQIKPWPYLAEVIACRRRGEAAPSLPEPVAAAA